MIWMLLAACQEDPVKSTEDAQEAELSWPQVEDNTSDTIFETTAIQSALSTAIATLPSWTTEDVFLSYDTVMLWSDGYCPYNSDYDGNALWYGGCDSSTGASFDGYLFRNVYFDYDLFGDGGTWDVDSISGVADIYGPNGSRVHYGGSIYAGEGLSPDGFHQSISVMEGSFLDEQFDSSWLSDGPSLNLAQYRSTDPEGNYEGYYINGAISIDSPIETVYFSELSAGYYGWDPSCMFNALGAIGFRHQSGQWAYAFLESSSGPSCDGCGTVYSDINQTEALGTVCLDVQSLFELGLQTW